MRALRICLVIVMVIAIQTCLETGPAMAQDAAGDSIVTIRITQDASGRMVYFDPVGVWVAPGTTIRWVLERGYHSVTAYHPDNGNYELRIPEGATPFNSGMLLEPGVSTFEVTLDVPGVYDYFCIPHEAAGMVGRIIVGAPDGPGSNPFGYDSSQGWREVPVRAQAQFPEIDEIMAKKVVSVTP